MSSQLCHTQFTINFLEQQESRKSFTSDWLTRGGGRRCSLHLGICSRIFSILAIYRVLLSGVWTRKKTVLERFYRIESGSSPGLQASRKTWTEECQGCHWFCVIVRSMWQNEFRIFKADLAGGAASRSLWAYLCVTRIGIIQNHLDIFVSKGVEEDTRAGSKDVEKGERFSH